MKTTAGSSFITLRMLISAANRTIMVTAIELPSSNCQLRVMAKPVPPEVSFDGTGYYVYHDVGISIASTIGLIRITS